MAKLHELLVVESDLKGRAQRALKQARHILGDKDKLLGIVRTYQPLQEDGQQLPPEVTVLSTTVTMELAGLWEIYGDWIDAAMQKETTNQEAKADLIVGDDILAAYLPATALLNLESKLGELRAVYQSIPINDPTREWKFDEQQGRYKSGERQTIRAKKVMQAFVKYEATPEHPAQVESYTEDVPVGTWTSVIHSGMVSPVEKAGALARLDELIRAVKRARQRANCEQVVDVHLGRKLYDFIHKGAA